MFEFLSGSLLYNVAKDIFQATFGRSTKRRLSPEQIVEFRQKWKGPFEEAIVKNWRKDLRKDVIIRDMRRIDLYPDIDESRKGISPWFRVGLIDLYHRGVLVAFQWEKIAKEPDGSWRETEYGEEVGEKVVLAGKILFENIEAVDWEGDEYYYFPHIYCHFSNRKMPYESVGYYREIINPGMRPHYSEVADEKHVKRRKMKATLWQKMKGLIRLN